MFKHISDIKRTQTKNIDIYLIVQNIIDIRNLLCNSLSISINQKTININILFCI
jgi:hypothetical protein